MVVTRHNPLQNSKVVREGRTLEDGGGGRDGDGGGGVGDEDGGEGVGGGRCVHDDGVV